MPWGDRIISKAFLKTLSKVSFLFAAMSVVALVSPIYAEQVIKIGGAGSILGSMKLLAKAFEKKYPDKRVVILPSIGNSGAIAAVSKGRVDIGVVCRPLNDKERKLGLSEIEYARTPLVFITGEDTNVSNVSTQEIIKILRGDIKTWPNGEHIRLILRQPTESNTVTVKEISRELSKAMDIALSRPWKVIALTDHETTSMVEKTPGAFSFSTLTQLVCEKSKIRALSYSGINPIGRNSVNDLYPIFKTCAMVTKPKPSEKVKEFVNFVKSPRGKKILMESGNSVTKITY
jgi:phosphate transport system substrate-binding protein